MGRFINADAFAATGQGLLGNNMFAYCLNNPVISLDSSGQLSTSWVVGGILPLSLLDGPLPVLDTIAILGTLFIGSTIVHSQKVPHDNPGGIDWKSGDKNHIMKGTKNTHVPGWKRFGFDPNDPNNWDVLIPIITGIVNKNNLIETRSAKGTSGTLFFLRKNVCRI